MPLDENVGRRLSRLIDPAHEVATVTERGWSGIAGSDLLGMAEQELDARRRLLEALLAGAT